MYYTYILFSHKLLSFYVGSTQHLFTRLSQHNSGKSKSTKSGIPWSIFHSFPFNSRAEAVQLERKIKKRGIRRFLFDNNLFSPHTPG
ncbi:MAG: GIY-YIG nuclease family protein [Saprospiraceae bacterium]|jgi:putative endonuclease|nr:GIY-YIG nuclease family protein [Saprospiraceae bacterium]MBP8725001.1 GIY-YIG nuclease family protein [Saprospiraceae bacterium]